MTGGRYSLSFLASQDVIDIIGYVGARDIGAAERLRDRLATAFARLAAHPAIGHTRHDLVPRAMSVRFWPIGRYLVIYRATGEGIEIVRVFGAAQDVRALLGDTEED